MKFQSIDVDRFGVLAEATFPGIDDGLSVIYGANGSGKTTLLHFLRGLFCGYSEGRRLGLLPRRADDIGDRPHAGGDQLRGGGSLRVRWDGDECRFARTEESGVADQLRVTLLRNDLESTHPRFETGSLRTDLFGRLYTASRAEGHDIEDLIEQATADAILLVSCGGDSQQLDQAATDIHSEQLELLSCRDAGRVAELTDQRQRTQAEIHRMSEELRHRCGRWESRSIPMPSGDCVLWQAKVTWLRHELAAAESDLREAEDVAWSIRPTVRTVRQVPATADVSLDQRTPRNRWHMDVRRIPVLKQLDRRIDHARTLLAESARARLDVSLRAARIAACEETPTEQFLNRLRDALASLEAGILDLRDETELLGEKLGPGECVCKEWEAGSREAVNELSKRLYQLCDEVSRFERHHESLVLAQAMEAVEAVERDLQTHLTSLRAERTNLLAASPGLRAWARAQRANAPRDRCQCTSHDAHPGGVQADRQVVSRDLAAQPPDAPISPGGARPSHEVLDRLRRRQNGLRDELDSAITRWRSVRNKRPHAQLPQEICALERQIDQKRFELGTVEASLADAQQRLRVLTVTGEVIRRVVERLDRDRQPTVIQCAAQYLNRLTAGRYLDVRVAADDHALSIVAADGASRPMEALSRGTLDQLDLSLRLALVRSYAALGIRFPLVLDDVLVDTDQQRLRAAVGVLREFVREHDQQILYLTCQRHLVELFQRHGTPVHIMPGTQRPSPGLFGGSELPAGSLHGWVDRSSGNEVIPAEPTTIERPTTVGHDVSARSAAGPRNVRLIEPLKPREPTASTQHFYLSLDSPVIDAPSIGPTTSKWLEKIGVLTVADLLSREASDIAARLKDGRENVETVRRWQQQATLMCRIPQLRGHDAQVLIACGISDPERLAGMTPTELFAIVGSFVATGEGQRLLRSQNPPDLDEVTNWIMRAGLSRQLKAA